MSQNTITSARRFMLLLIAGLSLSFGGLVHAQSSTITSSSASGMAGTATPGAGSTIASVDLSIRSGSLYWNGSAFQSAWTRVSATVSGNNWSYAFTPNLPGGIFFVSVRAIDSNGGVQSPMTFGSIINDSIRPNSFFAAGGTSPTLINGTASDAGGSGLNRVELSIRRGTQYWNGSAFQAAYTRLVTTLVGGNWSYSINPALPPGTYNLGLVAFDNAGNAQSPLKNASFVVGDSTKPSSTIASTSASQLTGAATDNVSVASVELAISNGTGFWNGSSFGGYTRVPATLSGSGTSVTWSYNISPILPAGSYSVTAIAFDASGNAQAAPFTSQAFTVEQTVPLKIMALGDSITAGFDADTSSGPIITSYRSYFEAQLDSTACFYEMVGSETENDPLPTYFSSNHEGYSGHRADHFLTGLQNNAGIDAIMAAENPDVILMHLGSNDMFVQQSVSSTVLEINDVINRVWAANPDTIILLANVIPWYGTSPFNPNVSTDIIQLGNELITMMQNIGDPRLRLANVRNGFLSSYMQPDLIHPNPDGEEHMAMRFIEALDQSGACGVPL